jgi:hypothetical protein
MHLDPAAIGAAVRNLIALLRPDGTLYLSWRVTDDASMRDPSGRLYAAFDKRAVLDELPADAAVLVDSDVVSASSGKRIQRLIVRKA